MLGKKKKTNYMLLAHNVLKDTNTEDDQSSMEQVENAKGDCLEKGHKGQL